MLKKTRILILILSWFCCILHAAESVSEKETLSYSVSPVAAWVPWNTHPEESKPGIFKEVTQVILDEAGINGNPIILPTKRAIKDLENGDIHFDFVSPDWFTDGNVGEQFVTSDSMLDITEWFITLPKNESQYHSLPNIYGNVVGTIRGYYYFDDARFTRMDFSSESTLIEGLKMNRFDVAILEEMTAIYWSQEQGIDISLAAIHTQGPMVLRIHKSKAALLPTINKAIAGLKFEGKIEAILNKYRESKLH